MIFSFLINKIILKLDSLSSMSPLIHRVLTCPLIFAFSQDCPEFPGPEVIKLFSWLTQFSMKFQMLISINISRNSAFFRLR